MDPTREGPRPVVTFFQPRLQEQVGLPSTTEASPVWKFLPKSNLSKVIIRDNSSVQRVQEIKTRHLEDSKKKMGNVYDQLKKKFMHDQQRKMTRWKKEYARIQAALQQMDERAEMKKRLSLFIPTADARMSAYNLWSKQAPRK